MRKYNDSRHDFYWAKNTLVNGLLSLKCTLHRCWRTRSITFWISCILNLCSNKKKQFCCYFGLITTKFNFKHDQAYMVKNCLKTKYLSPLPNHISGYIYDLQFFRAIKAIELRCCLHRQQDDISLQLNNVIFLVLVCRYVTPKGIECVCE